MAELHEELKKIREDRGITKKQMVEKIKIRSDFLDRLEEGDLTFVPMPFVRGFIREYADVIGIEPDRALQKLDKDIPTLLTEGKTPDPDTESVKVVRKEKSTSKKKKTKEKQPKKPQPDKSGETSETESTTENEVTEPPGPQTSLFDEPSDKPDPEPGEKPEEENEPTAESEQQDDILEEPPETSEPDTEKETGDTASKTEDVRETEDVADEIEENTAKGNEENDTKDDIPALSSETSLTSLAEHDDSAPQAQQQGQTETAGDLDKRAPLEIKEAESPGNIAFFIFIAVLIVLAVIILLMNRGSLF